MRGLAACPRAWCTRWTWRPPWAAGSTAAKPRLPACMHACLDASAVHCCQACGGTGCAIDEACGLLLASQPTSAQLALVLTMLALARASSGIAYGHHTPVSTGRLRALVRVAHWGRGQELCLLGHKMSFTRRKQDAMCLQVGCSGGGCWCVAMQTRACRALSLGLNSSAAGTWRPPRPLPSLPLGLSCQQALQRQQSHPRVPGRCCCAHRVATTRHRPLPTPPVTAALPMWSASLAMYIWR